MAKPPQSAPHKKPPPGDEELTAGEIARRQHKLLTPKQRERLSRVGGELTAFEIGMASSLEEALEAREWAWQSKASGAHTFSSSRTADTSKK